MDLSLAPEPEDNTNKKSKLHIATVESRSTEFIDKSVYSSSCAVVKPNNSKRESLSNGTTNTNSNNSWIEQIQFKAEYNHYRSNNYASVVNSSNSLDKASTVKIGLGLGEQMRLEPTAATASVVKDRERHSLCWNFPRVKLHQIFNAKSLDDILGRSQSNTVNLKTDRQRKNIKNTNHQQVAGPISSVSNSHSSLSSASVQGISSSAIISHQPQIHYHCEITPPSPKINLSTSSSDNNCYASANKFLTVPQQEVGKKTSSRKNRTESHSYSRPSVITNTKSDNCIHRISTNHTNSKKNSICSNVIKVPCGSNSVNHLDVLESVYSPAASSSVPLEHHSISNINPKKKIRFMNRVTPMLYSPDNEMEKISENQPKLVVASVSFLQRPLSPLPLLVTQTPSPLERPEMSNNRISPHVFNASTTIGKSGNINSNSYTNTNSSADEDNAIKPGRFYREAHTSNHQSRNNDSANSYHQKSCRPNPDRINFMNFHCCGCQVIDSDSKNTGGDLAQVQAQQQTQAQKIFFKEHCRSKENSTPKVSFISNNSALNFLNHKSRFISQKGDVDTTDSTKHSKEKEEVQNQETSNLNQKGMGDLQSPQYVKRTAHMFNSRYAATTSPQNGNAVPDETRKTTPSYINVSRSISGYSCLSYSGSNGYHGPNGTTTTSRIGSFQPAPYRRPTMTSNGNGGPNYSHNNGSHSHSSESDYSIKYKSTHTCALHKQYDGGADGPRPPPLPKTAPPLNLSPLRIGRGLTTYHDDVPVAREKSSFILNRIERLCGSTEVMSSWKRPGTTRTTLLPDTVKSPEKIIPIILEDYEEDNSTDNSVAIKSCPGKHNLLTDVVSNSDANENEKNVNNGQDIKVSVDDSVDGENSNSKAIPVHRNGNFKDWYDIGSKIDLEETGESGILLYESSKSISNKLLTKPENDPVAITAITTDKTITDNLLTMEGITDSENLGLGQSIKTTKRLPLTEVVKISSQQQNEGTKFCEDLYSQQMPRMNKENEVTVASNGEKNGEYFLLEMNKEKSRLDDRITIASEELTKFDSGSEEAGKIRAAIGKANLLCTKKFKQFRELCHTNLEQTQRGVSSDEPFTTKNQDLAGFWDMVLIQVDQIHSMFDDLDPNHTPTPIKPDSVVSAPMVPRVTRRLDSSKASRAVASNLKQSSSAPSKPKSESSTLRDESRRKLLADKRKAMKNQVAGESHSEADVQIFTPGSN